MKLFYFIAAFSLMFAQVGQTQEFAVGQKTRADLAASITLQNVTNYVSSETNKVVQQANAAILSTDALLAKLNAQASSSCPTMHFMKNSASSGALSCERFVVTTFPVSSTECGGAYCGAQYYACGAAACGRQGCVTSCTQYDSAMLNANYLCRSYGFARAATYTSSSVNYESYRVGRSGGVHTTGAVNNPGGAGTPTSAATSTFHGSTISGLTNYVLATVKCTN